MYHLDKKYSIKLIAVACTVLTNYFSSASGRTFASNESPTVPAVADATALSGNLKLDYVKGDFPQAPIGRALKKKPLKALLYQWDSKPLGNRAPFLFVHGLRGEYYRQYRWSKVINKFVSNPEFERKYKVYTVRWDSTARMEKEVPQFREAISTLFSSAHQRPITIIALSIGGNLVYESVLDKETDKHVRLIMTLGTPFHGSPLFNNQWLQYSVYKNLAMPWTRIDHSVAFRVYFHHNPSLQKDFSWDNVNQSIPDLGKFTSYLPLGPKGNLTVDDQANTRLRNLNEENFDKKKLITYSSYLTSPFMSTAGKRFLETTVLAPWVLVSMKVPAHFAREHAVLRFLNNEIGSVVSNKESIKNAETDYLYQMNDGIAPVVSALFIPDKALATQSLYRESDLPKLKAAADVRIARSFRNADHLTFIDGYRPFNTPKKYRDELNTDLPSKNIMDWMLDDFLQNSDPVFEDKVSP